MERALNRDGLADALGSHTPGLLPTVEELIQFVSEIEVGVFLQNFDVDNTMLRAAWYLHGVASASQATELYSLPRQRRAFAVSAHIFDLALNDTTRDDHERLTLTFAAQVGYRRGDLDPNATAVYRRSTDLLHADTGMEAQIGTLALQAGVAFLGLDPGPLGQWQRAWRRQLRNLADLVEVDNLQTTMFGPAEQVILATSSLLEYLRRGDADQLELAQTALTSVINQQAGQGDHDARWVAAHLLAIADGMSTSSIWSVLPTDTPDAVAQAFTMGTPAVLTLWPPQRDLLRRGSQNPLDVSTRRLLLSVPTSAGKTLLAQVVIAAHLATQTGDVCYVTPLRSLGREMREALGSRLRVLQRELGIDYPDYATTALEDLVAEQAGDEHGDVEVMTPERLMQQLRRDPESVLGRFSMFVIDEAHLLAQPGRGFVLESLLTFLATADSARLVLLSGVLGNAGSLAQWLDPDQPDVLFTSDWRGPRRMHALMYTDPLWDESEEQARSATARLPVRVTVPLRGKVRVRPAEGRVSDLYTGKLGVLAYNQSTDGSERIKDNAASTANYKMVATAASALLHAGSLLMIVSTRLLAARAAAALAETLSLADTTRELVAFLQERLGAEHPLVECVRHGVGFHHAGLPVDVLTAIEDAVRADQLVAIVATSTLTDGVNLPVRTVLISETTWEGQAAGGRLDPPRLLNAVGRAGRAGRETEGWIVLALSQKQDMSDFNLLTPESTALEARSTLLLPEAMDSLAAAEALVADTADAVFALAPGPASDFAGYVWFVLSALERLQAVAVGQDLSAAVLHLLGMEQMGEELRGRWTAFAKVVADGYDRTDQARRHRWTAAGTSLGTAARLDQIVSDLVATLRRSYPTSGGPFDELTVLTASETLEAVVSSGALDELLELPEADRMWRFRERPNGGAQFDVAVGPALGAWLSGTEISDLALVMLPELTDVPWRLEQTVDAVSAAFEHFLSWMIGIVIEQANAQVESQGLAVRLRPDFAALIRYGVDTGQALALLTHGIQSRRLAYRLGQMAEEQTMDADALRQWLTDLHIQGWRTELDASPREILDLLEFTRSPRKSLLRTLLRSGSGDLAIRLDDPDDAQDQSREVQLRGADRAAAELVVAVGDARLGVVGSQDHTDVLDLLGSGIELELTLTGNKLAFTIADES